MKNRKTRNRKEGMKEAAIESGFGGVTIEPVSPPRDR